MLSTLIVFVNLRRIFAPTINSTMFLSRSIKSEYTIHLDYCLIFARKGRKKIVAKATIGVFSSELTTTQHQDYNNICALQHRKCNAGGYPVPTHSVFHTTAGYIGDAVLQYNRAISLSRLFTHNTCSNNQTAGLAVYVLSRIVIEFS